MLKPLSLLNRIFSAAAERTLCGNDLLVLLHIFQAFNRSHWPESIQLRDAQLLTLCNIYDSNGKPASISTIRKAKARLKQKGFIDFEPGKGSSPTTYKITLTPVDTPIDTPIDTPVDTPIDTPAIPYIRAREEIKDVQDVQDVEEIQTTHTARANDLDEVVRYWEEAGGSKLSMLLLSKLEQLLKEHGKEEMRNAISRASEKANGKYGFSLAFFERQLKGKGAGKNGAVKRNRALPAETGAEPWATY